MRDGEVLCDIGMGKYRRILGGDMTWCDMYWESSHQWQEGRKQVSKSGCRKIDQNPPNNPGENQKGLNVGSSDRDEREERVSQSCT